MEACGTWGELRSQTLTVSPGKVWHLGRTAVPDFDGQPRNIVAAGPDLPARFLASVREELAGMLLNQVSVHDPDLITVEGEVDREIANQCGFPAAAFLAGHSQNRHV